MDRREFIQGGIALLGAAAASGYVGSDGTTRAAGGALDDPFPSYDVPDYSKWIRADPRDESGVVFSHIDWDHLEELNGGEGDGDDEWNGGNEGDDEELALIVEFPFYGMVFHMFAMYFGLFPYPFFGDVVVLGDETDPETEGVETSASTWAEEVFVFQGSYDPDVFAAEYTEGFEEVGERDGFTVYEGDGVPFEMAYAVSEDELVVALPPFGENEEVAPDEAVSGALDRRIDETDRAVDTDEGQWLFETTGEALTAFGVWETDDIVDTLDAEGGDEGVEGEDDPLFEPLGLDDNPVYENVESVLNNLLFEWEDEEGDEEGNENEITGMEARFSGLYPNEEAVPSEDEVREYLIEDEDLPHEIIIEETRVHAAITVEDDVLEETSAAQSTFDPTLL